MAAVWPSGVYQLPAAKRGQLVLRPARLPSRESSVACRTCRPLCSLGAMVIIRWSFVTVLLPLLVLLASNDHPSVATATAPSSTATEVRLEPPRGGLAVDLPLHLTAAP